MQLAIINRKGGVGKTTTAINLAAAFAVAGDLGIAERNLRTLLVDLDSQANASYGLGMRGLDLEPSLTSLFFSEAKPAAVVRQTSTPNLFLIPGSDRLATDVEPFVHRTPGADLRLKQIMDILKAAFDVVVYDCPPARGCMFTMAMLSADVFAIPLPVANFSIDGLRSMLRDYGAHRTQHPGSAALLGIVLTMMDYFPAYGHGQRADFLRDTYGNGIFETAIPKNKHLDDAQGAQQTIFEFRADSPGALAYRTLAREVIERARKLMLLPEPEVLACRR